MRNDEELKKFTHDLRNSLSVIYNYAQILENLLAKPGSENELEIARGITEGVKGMNELIAAEIGSLKARGGGDSA